MDIICHVKPAVDAAGALQHIIISGIERRKIYRNDGDRNNFLDRLRSILLDTPVRNVTPGR
jgi:putative transposase